MFAALKNLVAELSGETSPVGLCDDDLRVACAALLVHAATVDGAMSEVERDKLVALLRQRFDLDEAAASELVEQAAVAEQNFTRRLNDALDDGGRLRMIEMMWDVAYADGTLSPFEDNLIWRVADLLGVSSTERIALRRRVAAACGGGAA
ncbi:MAG: TerB family tellurite resistance protein [Rhizobiales bacterium]|nr:TerB family tellurite resistance protein [Hyphomicrobiales bacterium]